MAISYPLYLHYLGYEGYGLWLILTTVLTLAQLGTLGIAPAVAKLVAEELGRHNSRAAASYITTALAFLCISGVTVWSLVFYFRTSLIAAFGLSRTDAHTAVQLLPYVGGLSLYVFLVDTLNATLAGLGRMDLANLSQTVGQLLTVGIAIPLLHTGVGINSLLIANITSYIFLHLITVHLIHKGSDIRLLCRTQLDRTRLIRLMHIGTGLCGSTLLQLLLNPFNKLVLARYCGPATVPIYEIAISGSMKVRSLFESAVRALMPEVSRLAANLTDAARLRIKMLNRQVLSLVFVLGITANGSLFVLAEPLLRLWLRHDFTSVLPDVLRIALAGGFVSLLGTPAFYILLGLGMARPLFLANLIQSGVNIVVIMAMLLTFSQITLVNVVTAVAVGMFTANVYLLWRVHTVTTQLCCSPLLLSTSAVPLASDRL